MQVINNRRSVRKYNTNPVEKEKIEMLLRAGMQAPSAGNQQPWEFVIVKDKQIKDSLSQMSPYAGFAKEAPVLIVVLANQNFMKFPENMQQDLGAVCQNILLKAVDLDLGSTWLGVYPLIDRVNHLIDVLSLPEHVLPYAILSIGYPENPDANKYIDRYDPERVHVDKYVMKVD